MAEVVKRTTGRPLAVMDWELLDKTLARGGKMSDCVYFTGLSAKTIERRIREEHDMTYTEYRDLKLSGLRMKILDTQVEVALKGDPKLLIHLGEQLCGQVTRTRNENLNVNTSVEDYLRRLNQEGANGEG